jgi:hypothetical protein
LAVSTSRDELEIRAPSPEAYIDGGREHPMGVDVWPILDRTGLVDGLREEMVEALVASNEDPTGLLIRSPYVVHELRPTAGPRSAKSTCLSGDLAEAVE